MRYIRAPMEIDPALPVPIYQQLKTLIVDGILERRYTPDDRLPTEHELCELHGISRTPVNRALSELAAEGVILRHRRRGSFVNPLWLGRRRDDAELRVVVPAYGPWEQLVRDAADGANLNVVRVPRDALHRVLTHSVAEGQAPDLAVFDHVWAPEFGAAGFLHPLDDLDARWVRREHDVDFLRFARRRRPLRRPDVRRLGIRRDGRVVVQPAQVAGARPRCSDDVERVDQHGPGVAGHPVGCAAGAPRWHRGRRDHLATA